MPAGCLLVYPHDVTQGDESRNAQAAEAPGDVRAVTVVHWIDSWSSGQWTPIDQLQPPQVDHRAGECVSAGFIVSDHEDFLVLACGLTNDAQATGVMAIPKRAILHVRHLASIDIRHAHAADTHPVPTL